MNINKFEILKKVASFKNITKASHQLNMTQAAVSKAIKSLEDEYGFDIFLRSKSGVELTSMGKQIMVFVNQVLNVNRQLDNLVSDFNQLKKGKLVIASFSSASTRILPILVEEYSKKYPNIIITIQEGHYDEILGWLEKGVADIGILKDDFIPHNYERRYLFSDSIKLIAPSDMVIDNPVSIDIIEEEAFIVTEHYPNPYLIKLIQSYALKPNIRYIVKTNQTIFAFVEKGMGISLLPESSVTRSDYDFKVIDLKQDIPRDIYLVTKKETMSIPMVKAFWHLDALDTNM